MLDKKNPFTRSGQMLVLSGILNVFIIFNYSIDFVITSLLIARGGALIRNKKWGNDFIFNICFAFLGILISWIKVILIAFKEEYSISLTVVFMLPMFICSSFSFWKSIKLRSISESY